MANLGGWENKLELEENEVFDDNQTYQARDEGNRTLFNPLTFTKDYKLAQAYQSVRNLEYEEEGEVELDQFDSYLSRRESEPGLQITEHPRPTFPSDEAYRNRRTWTHYKNGQVLIIVDKGIYNAVSRSIQNYVLDIGREGYWGRIFSCAGGTPREVREFIKKFDRVGVLLVGAIVAPWYRLQNDFRGKTTTFPCDLYYMDTNANWHDPDGNGLFDNVTGNVNPELWVGRLWTPTRNGNDAGLINDYFRRNHQFRVGNLGHARSALAYVDDDWTGFGDCEMDKMFPSSLITTYTNPDTTDADLYKAEVNSLRSWTQLCAHSSPHSHSLRVPSENKYERIHYSYFRNINPPNSHFYNLFCCGPGRYTRSEYLGAWYIFDKAFGGKNNGLTAVASAKSGSMLYFADFYEPLGQGKDIGTSYKEWWLSREPGNNQGHSLHYKRWFYGLVLLGDPTLTWWKGAVPTPQLPENHSVFDHYPRKIELRWDPVNLDGVRYQVEVDYCDGGWHEQNGGNGFNYHNISKNTQTVYFVGAQRGRWRVRALIGRMPCKWSPWSYFRFTR